MNSNESPAQRKFKLSKNQFIIALVAFAIAYGVFLKYVPMKFWPKCPIHAVTGLWCPGCGSQRAAFALLNGDPVTAIKTNLMIAVGPVLVASAWWAQKTNRTKLQYVIAAVAAVIAIAFTIARNIPGSPLAP